MLPQAITREVVTGRPRDTSTRVAARKIAGKLTFPQRIIAPTAIPVGSHSNVAIDSLYGPMSPSFAVIKYAKTTNVNFKVNDLSVVNECMAGLFCITLLDIHIKPCLH